MLVEVGGDAVEAREACAGVLRKTGQWRAGHWGGSGRDNGQEDAFIKHDCLS
jgi:hypothetical protein